MIGFDFFAFWSFEWDFFRQSRECTGKERLPCLGFFGFCYDFWSLFIMDGCELALEFLGLLFVGVITFSPLHRDDILVII